MSFREQIERLTADLLEPILNTNAFELVDIEYTKEANNWYLRIYIDKDGGITIDDCELVSRTLEKELDEKDPVREPYILEISSPGLDRPLKKDKDLKRSIGKKIEVKLYKAIDKQKEFVGILKNYTEETITLTLGNNTDKTFNRMNLAIIRLAILF